MRRVAVATHPSPPTSAWQLEDRRETSFQSVPDSDSVADPDPGSGAFLTPVSGIRNRFFPDPGSQTHIFESLETIFWVKSSIIL